MSADAATDTQPARIDTPLRISGAQAVIRTLEELNVDLVFGYPGGAIMPIYDALHARAHVLNHILVRHEQGAVHAAEGYARTTGRPGVCMATSGPGATNFITGLADAMMDSTPVVCITGQVPSAMRGTDAFQESDVVGMTLGCTKWNVQVTDPAEIPNALRTAFKVAVDGRPGPVLVDITKDAQFGTLEADAKTSTPTHYDGWSYADRHVDLSGATAAATLINDAERPMMMIGQGVLLSGASHEARVLAERAGLPVACTLLGLSAIPADHPQYVGMLGMHGHYAPNMLTNEADVILAVGMRFDDRVTGNLEKYATNARIVHIDIDPAEINKCVTADVALVGDAKAALTALHEHIEARDRSEWRARFAQHEAQEMEQVITPALFPGSGPLRMGEVVHALSERTGGGAIIVSDVGQHQMFAARYYQFRGPDSHVSSGGLGTMGFALPAAIGAKLGNPERDVIAIIGDGGFQMTVQELGTIMQEGTAVKIVILNNGYLGMVRQWQELFFDRRYSEVHMENPDFVALCAAFRIEAHRVTKRDDLAGAIDHMLTTDGPQLLEVCVGAEDNIFPMIPAGAGVHEIRLS
jgi:acetolactate synthase I/II/III large subunit